MTSLTYFLPEELHHLVHHTAAEWAHKLSRFWARDASLWTGKDEAQWLGWLDCARQQLEQVEQLNEFAQEIKSEKFTDAVVLGMGGSSLCAEVFKLTFGKIVGFPELHVLDSTDPEQIVNCQQKIDLARTLFIVSSKSGSTLESSLLQQYFFAEVQKVVSNAAQHFIVITDPGSALHRAAEAAGFRRIFFGVPSIGGRYSALSYFGTVPAAIMGLDVWRLLVNAHYMVKACMNETDVLNHPAALLGLILGLAGKHHRDKITFIASPSIASFPNWLEQLIAESSGKNGRGLIPIVGETLAVPNTYNNDRLFIYLRLNTAPDLQQDQVVSALQQTGHPIVRLSLDDPYQLGQEFFRWFITCAVACSVLEVNPFDQPDVEASKIATRCIIDIQTIAHKPLLEEADSQIYADPSFTHSDYTSLEECLHKHLDRLHPGDYFAILAYVEKNAEHETLLQKLRHNVRDKKRIATSLGFGPRFLHSMGQLHKGGANNGTYLQITCNDFADLTIPDYRHSFNRVKMSQAQGDFQVLLERKRRVLWIHFTANLTYNLYRLATYLNL